MDCNIWQCVAATEPAPVTAAAAEAEPAATATEAPAESTNTGCCAQMPAVRRAVCKEAYEKLSSVGANLDGVAQMLDVSGVPEVVAGTASGKDVYLKFMSLFATQAIDGVITYEEWCDVMGKVSAMVDSDDDYVALAKSMWGL